MSEQRHVRLFRNGRNQVVRIPVEFELPGNEAIMHRDGDRLVIEPVRKRGLVALLKTMKPLQQGLPEIDDPVPTRRTCFDSVASSPSWSGVIRVGPPGLLRPYRQDSRTSQEAQRLRPQCPAAAVAPALLIAG